MASDGEIGHIKDCLFDDKNWVIRYLVADTGTWLGGRQVVLSPHSFGEWQLGAKSMGVRLTRKRIEESPSLESHRPVSRQFEVEYFQYYGWPTYWTGGALWGIAGFPMPNPGTAGRPEKTHQHRDDKHLQSARSVTGFPARTSGGPIGTVCAFMVSSENWTIHDVVVDTGRWHSGKTIKVSPAQIERIDYEGSSVVLDLAKAEAGGDGPNARPNLKSKQ